MKKLIVLLLFISFFNSLSLFCLEDLKSTENQADYLVVYHPEFKETIKEFVEWRRSKGVNVFPVEVNEIYSQFGDTVSNVDAIRDFVSYTLEFWMEPKPGYLLLVGGINHLPSKREKYSDSAKDSLSTDNYYAVNKYDISWPPNAPDIAMGRFPSRNAFDLNNMIEKTFMFEDKFDENDYKIDALTLTDKKDFEDFEKYSNRIIDSVFPNYLNVQRFYSREESEYFGDKSDLINYLNSGAIMLFNFFHGAEDVWMHYSLINSDDVDTMIINQKPFIINSIACSQTFDNVENKSILERFLSKKGCGAVVSIAANGVSNGWPAFLLIQTIAQEIFNNGEKIFGDAVLQAKIKCNWPLLKMYTYLGDPMLKLPDRLFQNTSLKDFVDNLEFSNYPNPCDEFTYIIFTVADNSFVEVEVYDILGNKVAKIFEGKCNDGFQQIYWDTSSLPSGLYICKLLNVKNILTRKIIVN